MGYGPIDPASLSGEALRRWYNRTADQLEREKQVAYRHRYNNFFGALSTAEEDGGSNLSDAVTTDSTRGETPTDAQSGTLQPTSYAAVQGQAGSAMISCPSCHGKIPPPPPVFPAWPLLRDIAGGGGSFKPRRKYPKQCEVQFERDGEICRGPGLPIPRHECWSRQNQRHAHCIKTDGEVGHPPLIRPWER